MDAIHGAGSAASAQPQERTWMGSLAHAAHVVAEVAVGGVVGGVVGGAGGTAVGGPIGTAVGGVGGFIAGAVGGYMHAAD